MIPGSAARVTRTYVRTVAPMTDAAHRAFHVRVDLPMPAPILCSECKRLSEAVR